MVRPHVGERSVLQAFQLLPASVDSAADSGGTNTQDLGRVGDGKSVPSREQDGLALAFAQSRKTS